MQRTVLSRKAACTRGALMAYLAPKLAQDAKIDLTPILAGVTNRNFGTKKAGILSALKTELKGKLAADANMEDAAQLLAALEKHDEPEAQDKGRWTPEGFEAGGKFHPIRGASGYSKSRAGDSEEALENAEGEEDDEDENEDDTAMDEEDFAALKERLKEGKATDEDLEAMDAMFKAAKDRHGARDESPEEKAEREKKEAADKKARDEAAAGKKPETVTKAAMDSAIAKAVRIAADEATKTQREIRDAERAVRPWVGELALAFDSAPDVYKHALESLGVNVKDVHPSALKPILEAQPKPGERNRGAMRTGLAMDASSSDSFSKIFPNAGRFSN